MYCEAHSNTSDLYKITKQTAAVQNIYIYYYFYKSIKLIKTQTRQCTTGWSRSHSSTEFFLPSITQHSESLSQTVSHQYLRLVDNQLLNETDKQTIRLSKSVDQIIRHPGIRAIRVSIRQRDSRQLVNQISQSVSLNGLTLTYLDD